MNKVLTTVVIGAFAATALLGACSDDKKSSGDDAGANTTIAGGDMDAYCGKLEMFRTATDSLGSVFDNPTPETLEAAFSTAQSMVDELASDAPDEIADDVDYMKTLFDAVVDLYSRNGWDPLKIDADPEAATVLSALNSEETAQRESALEAFAQDTCGLPPSED